MSVARAHINWGRWLATCPNAECNSAEEIHPWKGYECGHPVCRVSQWPETIFHCSYCRTVAPIEWPPNASELWVELERRAQVQNRNWYPEDHELAVRWNLPHGQTVNDLAQEREAQP